MIVIRTTLYRGGHANDPGYRSTTLDAGNGREWHALSDPDGSNARRLETRATGSSAAFRGVGSSKRAEEISKAIKAHLSGSNLHTAKTLDDIEPIAIARIADDWSRLQIGRSLLAELQRAEEFISGFEGDETQEGIDHRLKLIRQVIKHAQLAGITPDDKPAEPVKVWLVTWTNRHGTGTRVFSNAATRDIYSNALARKIWANHSDEEPPTDDADFWTAFYERFPDDNIEDDEAAIDHEPPAILANRDA